MTTPTFPKRFTVKGDTGAARYLMAGTENGVLTWCSTQKKFVAVPTVSAVSLVENVQIKGVYTGVVNDYWERGKYIIAQYKQAGGVPSPVADTIENLFLVTVSEGFIISLIKIG